MSRSRYESELQKEWNAMSWAEKMAKLRATTIDANQHIRKHIGDHDLVITVDGQWRFTTRIR